MNGELHQAGPHDTGQVHCMLQSGRYLGTKRSGRLLRGIDGCALKLVVGAAAGVSSTAGQ